MELMHHATTFLLPHLPPNNGPSLTYALVVLNQRLPRFTPLLWERGFVEQHSYVFVQTEELIDSTTKCQSFCLMKILWISERDKSLLILLLKFSVTCLDGFRLGWNKLLWYRPDAIKGDMDSVRPEVQEFYSNLGTKVVDDSDDQDTTDLHKCVAYIRDSTPDLEKSNLSILVAGALGGRFDHEVGNINVLYLFSNIRMVLLSDDCLIQLLPKTHHHEIHIQSSVEGPHCGLVPIGAPSASTSTTGLQWDLTELEMKFGGLISTSNIAREEKIIVRSDSDLLWTISIKKQK